MCYKERERDLLQAYGTGQKLHRQLDPLQGLESWLQVHLIGRKPFKQGLQAAPRRSAVFSVWNKSICRAAAVVRSSAAGAGHQLHSGACVLQGRVVL